MDLPDPFSPGVYSKSGNIFGDESDIKNPKPGENNKITPGSQKRRTTFATFVAKQGETRSKEKMVFPRLSNNLGKENISKKINSAQPKAEPSTEKKKSLKARALKSLSLSLPNSVASSHSGKREVANTFKIFDTEEENDNAMNKKSDDELSARGKCLPSPEYDAPINFSTAENNELIKIKKSIPQREIEKLYQLPFNRFLTHQQLQEGENDIFIEYRAKIQIIEKLRDNYKRRFTLDKLLKITRDPWLYFSDKERDCSSYSDHSLYYLKTKFRKHYYQIISDTLLFHNHNLYLTYKYLTKKNRGLRLRASNRPLSECTARQPDSVNPQFLLEVMFIESEEDMKTLKRNLRAAKNVRLRDAKRLDMLARCERCLRGDLPPEDFIFCNKGHSVCKNCIVEYIESNIARGSFYLKCLNACEEKYPLTTLQDLLDVETFSKLMEMYDIFESDVIPGLVKCPFCKFFSIESEKENAIMCLNAKCLLIYCRKCKELDHEPKKCEEIPLKYSSNPSKIVIQKCWKCEHELVKEEGCNEMICPCGSGTCHVCKNPVEDHNHFFLYEDEDGTKCPLYTTDFSAELDLF